MWYQSCLQLFLDRYPDLVVPELKPFHVQEWIDSYPSLSGGSKRNLCRSIMRAMRWAEKIGHIDKSPISPFREACWRKEGESLFRHRVAGHSLAGSRS